MTKRFCFAIVILLNIGLELACCSPEPFTGGVEVTTSEALLENPTAITPVPSVPDTGTASDGDHFADYTDACGVAQHPFAHTGVNWTVVASFSVVIEACPDGLKTGAVSAGGATFEFTCLL